MTTHHELSYLSTLFKRDLELLKEQLERFETEEDLWARRGTITNSSGTLTKHICGNLQHFVGAVMGKTGYVRNREEEFSGNMVNKAHLTAEIDAAIATLHEVLPSLNASALNMAFPIEIQDRKWTNGEFLLHLYGHLNYHLGQVDYLRRSLLVKT